ncbi:hypothetical protein OUZ56_028724 [Daphnia magna]|uniref:Secreted protein n=1 Tax=Daphnia magna TaxID=35525 RepID=A0ABR0B4R2_9CRUS|nr:hypothetical protein OUZ56_028724 [Daphnia magna]
MTGEERASNRKWVGSCVAAVLVSPFHGGRQNPSKKESTVLSFLFVTQPIRLISFFPSGTVGSSLVGLATRNTPFGRLFTFLPPLQRSAMKRNFRQQASSRYRREKATRLLKK